MNKLIFYSHLSVVIWFPLMDCDNFGAVWVMVKRTVQPGSGRSTTVTRTKRYRSQINSFLFAPLWWMRLDPRRKRYFVFPLIPGNKIVVNNDDNVHIVPIQCARHPTMAHYNNPQKQYTVYFRILGIAATPTELMAISFHGFALFCNFRRIFPYKCSYSNRVDNLLSLSPHWYGDRISPLHIWRQGIDLRSRIQTYSLIHSEKGNK